jgi:hypothetical protein
MRLTDRRFLTSTVTSTDLIHVVVTGDTFDSPQGSSFQVNLGKVISDLVPEDIHVTGFTFNQSNYDISIKQNGLPTLTQNLGILSTDVTVTGGTYDPNTGVVTFYKNIGLPFDVTGFATGYTDFYVTGGSFNQTTKELTLTKNGGPAIPAITGITDNYTNSATTISAVGGIASGSTFDNKSMKEMWDLLLYPYQSPSFNSSFSRTGILNEYELGRPVSALTETFSWVTSYSGNVSANTITIQQMSPIPSLLISGYTNTGSYAVSLISQQVISASTPQTLELYKITGTNTKGIPFTSSISRTWKYRWYWGKNASETLTASQITGFTNGGLTSSVVNTKYIMPSGTTSEYMYFAIPVLPFIQPFNWKEATSSGNDIPSGIYQSTVSILNQYGVTTTYNVYRSEYSTSGSFAVFLNLP